MATTFGFFNAKKVGNDYDRKYSADNLAEYFDPIVGSGVSVNEENGYKLKAQSGLKVLLESGFAWIKGYYIRDTTATELTFAAAPSSQSRYDAVILRLSKADRTVKKLIIKGAESSTPKPPNLKRTADTYDLMLGYVVRKAGTSSITQDMIVDTREDTSLCGLIDTFAARLVPDGSITKDKLANSSVTGDKITKGAVTNEKIANGAVTNSKLADGSVGNAKLLDSAVSAEKISYGALVAIKNFSVENSTWTENSYGTYNKKVTIDGIDPEKHIGLLCLTRSVKIPDVDTAWGFSSSMLDTDDEKMSCIFGCKITAVNELTLTAKEKPAGTIYLTLAVMHI